MYGCFLNMYHWQWKPGSGEIRKVFNHRIVANACLVRLILIFEFPVLGYKQYYVFAVVGCGVQCVPKNDLFILVKT